MQFILVENTKISLETLEPAKSSPVTPPPPPLRLEAPREDDERVVERVAPRRVDGHGIQQIAGDFGGGEVRRDDF